MVDGIIFDVDGTFWDITDVCAEAWTDLFSVTPGITDLKVTGDDLKALFGRTLHEIADVLFPDFSLEDKEATLYKCYAVEDDALADHPPIPYDGVEDTLKELYQDYPLFIVSNSQAGYIERFLSATGYGHYFKDFLCPGMSGEAKAANIRTICNRHGLKNAVYVGDIDRDAIATHEAGLRFIWASYGFGTTEHAEGVINSMRELPALLKKM